MTLLIPREHNLIGEIACTTWPVNRAIPSNYSFTKYFAFRLKPIVYNMKALQSRHEKISHHDSFTIVCNCHSIDMLKKYGSMIPSAHRVHQTLTFSGCNGVSTLACRLSSFQIGQFSLDQINFHMLLRHLPDS